MGQVITTACALSGYRTIMACRNISKASLVRDNLLVKYPDTSIEVVELNLASRASIKRFAEAVNKRSECIDILVNNAGVISKQFTLTEDDTEMTAAVNYVGPFLLTHLLLPMMNRGSRIVNTVSVTYKIGKITAKFFKGDSEKFSRLAVYANTKLALLLFTLELADRIRECGITVNAVDPGVVSTRMIRMDKWFDRVADLIYRPLIKSPVQGAQTAVLLALSDSVQAVTGKCYANCKPAKLSAKILNHPCRKTLWNNTEQLLKGNIPSENTVRG